MAVQKIDSSSRIEEKGQSYRPKDTLWSIYASITSGCSSPIFSLPMVAILMLLIESRAVIGNHDFDIGDSESTATAEGGDLLR
jgi:hypothetical protein